MSQYTAYNEKTYQIRVKGLVQGVGFRPFIYRIAMNLGIKGTVENRNDCVIIMCNATEELVQKFCNYIVSQVPPPSDVQHISCVNIFLSYEL